MAKRRITPKRRSKTRPQPEPIPQALQDILDDVTYLYYAWKDTGLRSIASALAYGVRRDMQQKEREARR